MLTNNDRITVPQAVALLITATVGVGILGLPHQVAKAANSDGWILVILGGLFTFAVSLITGAFVKKYPEDTIVEASQKILGKLPSYLMTAVLVIYFVIESGIVARIFASVIKAFMLHNTPTEFVVITLLLSTVYLIRHGIEPIARAGEILFPILIIPIFAMYLTIIKNADFSELLPFLTTPPKQMALGVFPTMLSFLGFEIMLVVGPYIRSPGRIYWILFASIGTVTAIYFFVTVVAFIAIGVDDAKVMMWPAMTVIRSISAPGMIFERLDALAMALWIIATFTTINGAYFTASLTFAHRAKAREFKAFVTILFPWIYLVAIFPENVLLADKGSLYLGIAGMTIAFAFPFLVMLVGAFRRGGGKTS